MSIEVKLSTQKLTTTTNNSIKKKCICISFRDESNNFRIRLVSLLNIDRIAEENARTQPHVVQMRLIWLATEIVVNALKKDIKL